MAFQFEVRAAKAGDEVSLSVSTNGAAWFAVGIPPDKLRAVAAALIEEADAREAPETATEIFARIDARRAEAERIDAEDAEPTAYEQGGEEY